MEQLRIVAIGGGTGLSTLLHGLKRYAAEPREIEITAVVTVTDDGGSSGRLRREFDVLPPGGSTSNSRRRRPELPPSSVTVTTAVISISRGSAAYLFKPCRSVERPVPPPIATMRSCSIPYSIAGLVTS